MFKVVAEIEGGVLLDGDGALLQHTNNPGICCSL